MLEARDLSYAINDSLLVDNVTLAARDGEVLSIVGPNGAGKSTLLRLLSGELSPCAGAVYLQGDALVDLSAREIALRRAVLPQQTILQFAFTAEDVVLMGRNPHLQGSWPDERDREIAHSSLARTDMSTRAGRKFPTLSGGEQSRVTLARVLAQEAPVLLLDEPTSALDVRHQEMVMQIAGSLAAEGACVVMVIHDLNLAAAYSQRIAVMQGGRLVAYGPTCEVMQAELLSEVFECPLRVIADGERRLVVPVRGRATVPPAAGPITAPGSRHLAHQPA